MSEVNYYNLLAVARSAVTADIKASYRRLSLKYHPDSGGSTEQMVLLNRAYGVLSNPLLRREYDHKHQPQTQRSYTYAHAQTSDFNFTRNKPSYQSPPPQRPVTKTRRDESMWQYEYASRAESPAETRKHFWPWFAVSFIVLGFFIYQVFALFQPSSDASATGVATVPTSTIPTTPTTTTTPTAAETTPNIASAATGFSHTNQTTYNTRRHYVNYNQ